MPAKLPPTPYPETREVQVLLWILEEERLIAAGQQQILCELRIITGLLKQLLPPPPNQVDKIALVFGGKMPATPGTVAVGSTVVGSIVPLEADGVTVTPGAVVSAQSYSVDNPSLVSFVTNPDGTATFTGVAVGTATVTASATVTDASGTANSFTATNTLTVTQTTGVTASIQLNFSSLSQQH